MLIVALSLAFADPSHSAIDGASWSELTRKNHADAGEIVIKSTQIGGVDCFRGEATTDVAGSKLLDVVADVEGAVSWSTAGLAEAKLLAKSGNKLDYYQFLDVPGWTMASDRFWFLTSVVESTDSKWSLKWNRLENGGAHAEAYAAFKASHSSAVEPPVNVGSWVFEASDGGTRMTYSVCTDSGGSIPAAVQSAATRKTLPDTLGDVVREARTR